MVLPVLSGLPRSFTPAADGDVVAVGGEGNWPADTVAAIERGARGVVVMEPGPVPPSEVDAAIDAASSAGVPVRVARQWASTPAVADFAARPAGSSVAVLVDSQAVRDR